MNLSILYRGPLASCNYDCPYCPFAKRRDDPAALRADRVGPLQPGGGEAHPLWTVL